MKRNTPTRHLSSDDDDETDDSDDTPVDAISKLIASKSIGEIKDDITSICSDLDDEKKDPTYTDPGDTKVKTERKDLSSTQKSLIAYAEKHKCVKISHIFTPTKPPPSNAPLSARGRTSVKSKARRKAQSLPPKKKKRGLK